MEALAVPNVDIMTHRVIKIEPKLPYNDLPNATPTLCVPIIVSLDKTAKYPIFAKKYKKITIGTDI